MFKSISPVPVTDSNLPIALRRAVEFPVLRGSVFDDPGDEKSWHISQRAENLSEYYKERDSSWYASAVAPLAGADRVLDLGCGLGLALRALREQGSSTALGIDRWPAFAVDSSPVTPIVVHDLSLPMPFLESASFDGALSHYALDYVSPICARQILREAHRVLAPGGLFVAYLAGIGLAGGDESRTVAYSPESMRTLLAEAGFEQIEVTASSEGRNTVAKAWRPPDLPDRNTPSTQPPAVAINRDTQLSASFARPGTELTFELSDGTHRAAYSVELPSAEPDVGTPVSACARAQQSAVGTELQLWVWCGFELLLVDCVSVEFTAMELRIAAGGEAAGHISAWSPEWLSLEPPGEPHARRGDLEPGEKMSDVERGGEGRRIVVESVQDRVAGLGQRKGPGANRFPIAEASRIDLAELDREWLAGDVFGIAIEASQLNGDERRNLLLWAGWRQALLYIGGEDWDGIHATVERRRAELTSPVILTDPAFSAGADPHQLPSRVVALATENDNLLVLLHRDSLERSRQADLAPLADRLLLGGPHAEDTPLERDATENLRYLTERTLLLRLRQVGARSWGEVGRRRFS